MSNFSFRTVISYFQKRFLQSTEPLSSSLQLPATTSSSPVPSTLEFLVNSCRLPPESALSVSHKFQLNQTNFQKAESVLTFLKSNHFTDRQIETLIVKYPQILQCRVKNNLHPKFDFLKTNGFVGKLLPHIVILTPGIFRVSLDSQIKGCFELLRSVLVRDDKIVSVLKCSPWLLVSNLKGRLQPNINLLKKEGLGSDNLGKFMILEPRCMFHKPERMAFAVNSVKGLGFEPAAGMFLHALKVKLSMPESVWKKKIELMKSFGWSEDEVLRAFKRFPACFSYSEQKLRDAVDFYLNTLKLEPRIVIENPLLLGFSIERRILPRYNALKVLESKKLVEGIINTKWYFLDEIQFRKKYVDKYKHEVPGLLETYLSSKAAKKGSCLKLTN
ncbi:Mitochondrial transcription termination factor family protein [Euphorbia peplus]|nr:Mitochondrial transcription termination factor family protein [Euphorbia peplus]